MHLKAGKQKVTLTQWAKLLGEFNFCGLKKKSYSSLWIKFNSDPCSDLNKLSKYSPFIFGELQVKPRNHITDKEEILLYCHCLFITESHN